MDMQVGDKFEKAAVGERITPFPVAFDRLVKNIERHTRNQNIDQAEPQIRQEFLNFLYSQNYYLAAKNFEKLLEEKSGDKFLRNDGTTNWYHEFIPLMAVMYMGRIGNEKGGFDVKDLEPDGGLETAIITHLRHDSIEDQPIYRADPEAFHMELLTSLLAVKLEHPDYDEEKGKAITEQAFINIGLMSQQRVECPEGGTVKESVREYTKRMVASEDANPIVFMLKQADGVHNFATMWAPKFTPEKRLSRCNDREDMYGPRNGYTDAAMERWPRFGKAIKVLDSMMGTMLYTHFRYLESVDRHYKEPDDFPIGISRYLSKTMRMGLPEPVNMVHIFVKNLMTSVDKAEEPEKYGRLQTFLENNFRPPFRKHAQKFPYLFASNNGSGGLNGHAAPAPLAP
jgi:hypothetical protein